jgi:glucose/arabinose dehydrogenase
MGGTGGMLRSAALAALVGAACTSGSGPVAGPSGGSFGSTSPGRSPSLSDHPPTLQATLVAKVRKPLAMAFRAGDPALYVATKPGAVWALRDGRVDPTPVLDLTGKVTQGPEQGLLGLAFSPTGAFIYVDYTDRKGDTNVVEFAWKDGRADRASRRSILFVRQPYPNHNGGNLLFGPDGDLYIGMGDGGSDYTGGDQQGDPHRNGQNLHVLLGKMLRIQPRMPDGSLPPAGAAYAIPSDNPFVGRSGARPEIWAFGLRNPWRFSFDRTTGDLWIGDVGAGSREEVDLQPSTSKGAENYGWNAMEGTAAHREPPPDAVPPVYEYDHRGGQCAVTGGFVYRGTAIPDLAGWYVYGDYCTGTVSALRLLVDGSHRVYVASGADIPQLSSFGHDQQGELYVMSLERGVYKLTQ